MAKKRRPKSLDSSGSKRTHDETINVTPCNDECPPDVPLPGLRGLSIEALAILCVALSDLKKLARGWGQLADQIGVSRQRIYDWFKAPITAKKDLEAWHSFEAWKKEVGEKQEDQPQDQEQLSIDVDKHPHEPDSVGNDKGPTPSPTGNNSRASSSNKPRWTSFLPSYEQAVTLGMTEARLKGKKDKETVQEYCKKWVTQVGLAFDENTFEHEIEIRQQEPTGVAQELVALLPAIRKSRHEIGENHLKWALGYYLTQSAFAQDLEEWVRREPSGTIGFVWNWEGKSTIQRLEEKQSIEFVRTVLFEWSTKYDVRPNLWGFILRPDDETEFGDTQRAQLTNAASNVTNKAKLQKQDRGRWRLYILPEGDIKHYSDVWFCRPITGEKSTNYIGWLLGDEDNEIEDKARDAQAREFNERPYAWSVGLMRLNSIRLMRILEWHHLGGSWKDPGGHRRPPEKWEELYICQPKEQESTS